MDSFIGQFRIEEHAFQNSWEKKYNQQPLSNLLRLTFLLNMFEVFYLHVVLVKC